MNILKTLKSDWSELNEKQRLDLKIIALLQFLVLFAYPLVRSSIDAIFIQAKGAKNTPLVWTFSLIALSISISLFNYLQKKLKPETLYIGTSFAFSLLLYVFMQDEKFVYALYVVKEVYIVLLVHLAYAYLNTCIDYKIAKRFYGPFGAIVALGGIFGGQLTSYLAGARDSDFVLIIGILLTAGSSLLFKFCQHSYQDKVESDLSNKPSPLEAVMEVKERVFLFALVIMLSQFVISIANFKFNISVDQLIADKDAKTAYFGQVYSQIGVWTFLFQVILVPLLYRFVSEKVIQYSSPVFYLLIALVAYHFNVGLGFVAFAFAMFKSLDYSLFSTAKEVFYFHFTDSQKYGAKYLVDMIAYRLGKGIISILLIYYQTDSILLSLLYFSLLLWIIAIWKLFKKALPEY
jgi:ATP:ADP antiporter, AAA family